MKIRHPAVRVPHDAVGAEERTHDAIAERHRWDLTDLYPSAEEWDAARRAVLDAIPSIEALRGTLGENSDALYRALRLMSDSQREALRVWTWASLRADEDLRISETQEYRQLAQTMFTRLSEATAWYRPEILRLGRDTIMSRVDGDVRLEPFRHGLDDLLRRAPHTLGDETEQVLAAAGQPLSAPYNVYGLLANSDIPWPTITLTSGEEARIDSQGYAAHRQAPERQDRREVFDAYWGTWTDFRSSVGMTLSAHLQAQVFLARSRNYGSVLERELFEDNMPPEVYRTLVAEVNDALPTLHRYFRLRQRMLGLEDLRYYDIYPPLVAMEREFSIEDAKRITLEAMSVLGDDWVEMQREALDRRWMDVYPEQGKRAGAYMAGSAYDVHPYLLLNFQDDYESVSTFAHEWGHAMHTLYAQRSQPFETSSYAIFIAEIPSTTLELILQEHMVSRSDSAEEQLFYLGSGLEQMRGTFFRQTMFAEFELTLYEAIERGEALSGQRISNLYADIVRRYHGHDNGVVLIDDLYTNEWMFIQHFYYNMYVYQYATSLTAGSALFERIKEEGSPAVDRFKDLLRAGGADYPYQLLLDAGVDLASPEPYRALVRHMDAVMDRMEELLGDGRSATV